MNTCDKDTVFPANILSISKILAQNKNFNTTYTINKLKYHTSDKAFSKSFCDYSPSNIGKHLLRKYNLHQ